MGCAGRPRRRCEHSLVLISATQPPVWAEIISAEDRRIALTRAMVSPTWAILSGGGRPTTKPGRWSYAAAAMSPPALAPTLRRWRRPGQAAVRLSCQARTRASSAAPSRWWRCLTGTRSVAGWNWRCAATSSSPIPASGRAAGSTAPALDQLAVRPIIRGCVVISSGDEAAGRRPQSAKRQRFMGRVRPCGRATRTPRCPRDRLSRDGLLGLRAAWRRASSACPQGATASGKFWRVPARRDIQDRRHVPHDASMSLRAAIRFSVSARACWMQ
jgi:hypothetical protein